MEFTKENNNNKKKQYGARIIIKEGIRYRRLDASSTEEENLKPEENDETKEKNILSQS